jgi:hypothetical protein
MHRLLVVVTTLALAACGSKSRDGASCDEVGARFVDLAKRQLDEAEKTGGLDTKTHASVASHVPAMRDAMVRHCKEGGWSAETRGCFAKVTTDSQMNDCYASMPADQRAKLEQE